MNHAVSDGFNAFAAQRGPELFEGVSKSISHIGDALDYAVAEPLRITLSCATSREIEEMEFE